MMRCLLVRVGKLDERRLAVSPPEEGDADGKIVRGEPRGHRDHRDVAERVVTAGQAAARLYSRSNPGFIFDTRKTVKI
jgi:hypothetical protein